MKGKICLITGASSGIGKATAMGLAEMGATVILLGRNESKTKNVVVEIIEKTKNNSVDLLIADLSSQAQIRRVVNEFKDKYQKLHVLINNAGTYFTKRHVTGEGFEMTLAVNYLARFLMTNLLLDTIKNSAPARIIEVAGAYHTKGRMNFEDLQLENNYSGSLANNQSKLANVLFTYELARKLEGDKVTVNCLHPGVIASGLVEKDPNFSGFSKIMYKMFKPFFNKPEKGAKTPLYLASSPEVLSVTGKYFVNKKEKNSSTESYNKALAKSLWEVSLKLTELN